MNPFAESDIFIGYAPLEGEPDFGAFLKKENLLKPGVSVLTDRSLDPFAFAESLQARYVGKHVCIFIPGTAFDALGTRYGRGGGWYDRFLSKIPREWQRIGVLNAAQLSSTPLTRQPWDEPMDWLLVKEDSSWKTIKI